MKYAQLEELARQAHTHPHYKFRTKSDCLEAAQKSFFRLPIHQQEWIAKEWVKYLKMQWPGVDWDKNPGAAEEKFTEFTYYRFLAQTNLFFLCQVLEKYSQVTVGTHEEICNKFFAQKDPTFVTFEMFANQYSDLKKRMLLVPRGGFKSSIDIADCVQWIICYPAVTILILTGVLQLAKDFVGELRQHFTLEQTAEVDAKGKPLYGPRKIQDKITGDWSASIFQVLFPEHCIKDTDGRETEFQTPAVIESDGREPSVRAASIEQSLSGMHFGVLKLDDVVTNENSQTLTRLETVNKQISINRAMLHPYGFMDVIGTWYDEQDYYGLTIKQEEKFAKEEGVIEGIKGSVDDGVFDSCVYFRVYLRACWWPTEEAKKLGRIEEEMTRADRVLWFSERLPYEFLIQEQKTDPDGFALKYLNNPRKLHRVKFPRELLMRRTIPHGQLPTQGFVVTVIDTAYSTKSWADYTVILTALIFGGRFYIINMARGRYNEYEMPAVIAATAYKWKPKRLAIEDSVGVKWMSRELKREMDKLRISIPVEFISLGLGNKSKSKQIKAKPVVRLLGDERMYFLNSCEGLQDIYSELEKFTGTSDDVHDDIVSALSLLAEQFGAYADMDSKINFASSQYVADRRDQEWHDRIYCLGRYAQLANQVDDNPVTTFETEAASQAMSMVDSMVDPLADLFGE